MSDTLLKRLDYAKATLSEDDVGVSPLALFRRWISEAEAGGVAEPAAMSLCTVSPDGQPSSRIVLLRGAEEDFFRFFTNYDGKKARDISHNPRVALLFFWPALERQIRIEGIASKCERAISETYFAARPRESQLGAWASTQSCEVPGRAELEQCFAEVSARYEGKHVPCPPHWGGYDVRPQRYEFWQGRSGRLHDRLSFDRTDAGWRRARLAP